MIPPSASAEPLSRTRGTPTTRPAIPGLRSRTRSSRAPAQPAGSLDGTYAFWAPTRANLFTVIAGKDGWTAKTIQVRLKAGRTNTQNFTLQKIC